VAGVSSDKGVAPGATEGATEGDAEDMPLAEGGGCGKGGARTPQASLIWSIRTQPSA